MKQRQEGQLHRWWCVHGDARKPLHGPVIRHLALLWVCFPWKCYSCSSSFGLIAHPRQLALVLGHVQRQSVASSAAVGRAQPDQRPSHDAREMRGPTDTRSQLVRPHAPGAAGLLRACCPGRAERAGPWTPKFSVDCNHINWPILETADSTSLTKFISEALRFPSWSR